MGSHDKIRLKYKNKNLQLLIASDRKDVFLSFKKIMEKKAFKVKANFTVFLIKS